jgi:hypothetical protein
MKLSTTRRHYAIAAILVLAAVLLWGDLVRRYVQVSAVQGPAAADSSAPEAGDAAGWRAFFGRTGADRAQFAVIAERNVFSPSRKAWAEGKKDGAGSSAAAGPPAARGDVQLLGLAFMGGDRKVILRIASPGPGFTKSYGEGDVVSGPGESSGPMFRVLEIGDRLVRLEDAAGEEFTVTLFGHEREEEDAVDESIYTTPTPMVIVGDTPAETGQDESVDGEDDAGSSEYVSEEEEARNEQLVREGKLKKIETPFGPVYRKLDNESE